MHPPSLHRRSLRLPGYDYAQSGAYFVTLCLNRRLPLFGEVRRGEVALTDAGRLIESEWTDLAERFPTIELDAFIVMPDHVHGILLLRDDADAGRTALGDVVGAFKSLTTSAYARGVRAHGWTPFHGRLWQRGYFERVIRSEAALRKAREYIRDNPVRWAISRGGAPPP